MAVLALKILKILSCLDSRLLSIRGYDSAGIAIFHKGHIKNMRVKGKLKGLENILEEEFFDGHLGMGHTRWATHGEPSERNAHPHYVKGVSIVHNGVIENYSELKKRFKNSNLKSETDSELIAHCIAEQIDQGHSLFSAVCQVIPQLKGSYSVLVLCEKFPEQMIAFKKGPPLAVAPKEDDKNCIFVSSDVQAILPHSQKVMYLEDGEILLMEKGRYQFFLPNQKPIKKKVVNINWTQKQAQKMGYPHFMLKEIFEQPLAVRKAVEPHVDFKNKKIKLFCEQVDLEEKLRKIKRIFIVACGTSFYAGLIAKYLFEKFSHIPVDVEMASEFRYRSPVIEKESLIIFISQSGETADTLAALELAQEKGSLTLSLCNVPYSAIDRQSHIKLYMNAGPEIGVASTKAFVSTLAVIHLMCVLAGRVRGKISLVEESEFIKNLLSLPSQMELVLSNNDFFLQTAQYLKGYKGFLYIGRGIHYPIALEGALKLKELAYRHAEGYPAGEMKHGPLALVDEDMLIIVLAPKDDLYQKTLSNLEEVKARGGHIISMGTDQDNRLRDLSKYYLNLPKTHWSLNPILEVVPLQLLAYHVACVLGHDVDQPRNLAKSVTVE